MTRRDFGSVRRLESGRFQARYVDRNGRTRTTSFDTKRQAVEHLAEVRADLKRGGWQDPTIARCRFGEYAQECLDSRVAQADDRQQYAGTLRKHVLPHLGGYALEELTSARVRSWYAALARSTSATPDSAGVRARADGLEHAVDDDILLRNPCRFCGAGVARTAQRPIATLAQVEVLAKAVYPRYRALVLLAPGSAPAGTSSSRSPATGWTSRPGRWRSTGSTSCSPCKPYERACVEHGEGAEGGEPQSREREVGHVVRPQP